MWAVGDDWDNAVARTPAANQTVVDQYLARVGDTYWVQRQTVAANAANSSVTISDTAPTTDRFDLSLVEIVPPSPTPPHPLRQQHSPQPSWLPTRSA